MEYCGTRCRTRQGENLVLRQPMTPERQAVRREARWRARRRAKERKARTKEWDAAWDRDMAEYEAEELSLTEPGPVGVVESGPEPEVDEEPAVVVNAAI